MILEAFAEGARRLGVSLDRAQLGAFQAYREHMLQAAARFSLTAIRDPDEIERRHFLESLALGRDLIRLGVMPGDGDCKVVDIGAGAGIPGLALKIAWPRMHLSLLDSNEKRCRFLRSVIEELRLEGAVVLEGRAEAWGHDPGHREAYDLALARALAPLPVLLEYALPFVRVGGWLAAPKGSAAAREIGEAGPALAEFGGVLSFAEAFEVPGAAKQTLVIVRKAKPTPDRYPRRPGIPAKRPVR